jgi:hypothetical protein
VPTSTGSGNQHAQTNHCHKCHIKVRRLKEFSFALRFHFNRGCVRAPVELVRYSQLLDIRKEVDSYIICFHGLKGCLVFSALKIVLLEPRFDCINFIACPDGVTDRFYCFRPLAL